MGGRLCREMSFPESKRVSWRRYPSHTAACLTIDRIGSVGVSAPTANRQTQVLGKDRDRYGGISRRDAGEGRHPEVDRRCGRHPVAAQAARRAGRSAIMVEEADQLCGDGANSRYGCKAWGASSRRFSAPGTLPPPWPCTTRRARCWRGAARGRQGCSRRRSPMRSRTSTSRRRANNVQARATGK